MQWFKCPETTALCPKALVFVKKPNSSMIDNWRELSHFKLSLWKIDAFTEKISQICTAPWRDLCNPFNSCFPPPVPLPS